MANNYCQFSAALSIRTPEERDYLEKALDLIDEEGYFEGVTFELGEKVLYIMSEECGDPDFVCGFVAEFQQQCHCQEAFIFEWANTCSKMRTDEFSGGCAAVYKGETQFFDPRTMAHEWLQSKGLDEKRIDAEPIRHDQEEA